MPHPDPQAGHLACPRCGASVACSNHICEFCRAELLVKACPRCFARVFHGHRHCGGCGADVTVPAAAEPDGQARQRRCPRCESVALEGRLVDDVLLDECPSCHGVYVDHVALERVVQERKQARAESLLGALPSKAVSEDGSGRVYIECPDCDALMNRRNFARGAGVIIDVCRFHGTWFDADELPHVIRFVMQGGLEQAAQKDAERARDEARQAARLAQAMRFSEPSGGRASATSDGASAGSVIVEALALLGALLFDD